MKRIHMLLAASIAALALIVPVGPVMGDDPTPSPSIPCDTSDTILTNLAQIAGDNHEEQMDIRELNRRMALQQGRIEAAYRVINRKNLRIARLQAQIEQLKTGLHS